jgi:hypothetical protein
MWTRRFALAAALMPAAAHGFAQYPGQVAKDAKKNPELRAVAVLEWTGEAGKPKACRIVPVSVLDEGHLEDGGIYLARPQPLALAGEVEYELENNGKTIGLFDIENSGQEQGSWVGYGAWKSMPAPSNAAPVVPKIEDEDDDKPILHRKKHVGDANPAGGSGGASSGSGSPTSSGGSGSNSAPASNAPAPDSDRPVLHKKTTDDNASASTGPASGPGAAPATGGAAQPDDPDRPKLKKDKKKPEDVGHVESLPEITDPDRPRLKRGRSEGSGLNVVPSLMGLPADMQQAVAVSDVKDRPEHPWSYAWANPDDEGKMKAALEDIARDALGLKAPTAATTPKKTGAAKTSTTRKSLKPALPVAPAPLADEQFRVFELAYGSGATLVLTAHTDGPKDQMKFVTLVAQPDLYGNVRVLLKNVTDGAHLDENPRMRLVDAVDALADNRGELLFELRGDTQRQFALYRVLRGQAEKLFVSSGGEWGTASN